MLDYKTFASLAWWFFERSYKIKQIWLMRPSLLGYKLIKGYSTAGRCQVFKGLKHHQPFDQGKRYVMIDVVSLYPWAYLYNYYPCGGIYYNMSYKMCI
jgi:hypothetical protein